MPAKIKIDGSEYEMEGTIVSFIISLKKNPDSYLFLIENKLVPMDIEPNDGQMVEAIRVASGG